MKQQDHYHNVTTHTSKRSPPVSPTKMAKSSSSSSSSTRSSSRPQSPAQQQQRPIDEEHHGTLYIPSMAFSNRWKRQSNKSQRLKNMVVSNQVSVMWAPAPAMYWSQPTVHGVVPKPVRAHTSVAVNDLMYVFGGSGNNGCSHTLYALEMGKKIDLSGKGEEKRENKKLTDPTTWCRYLQMDKAKNVRRATTSNACPQYCGTPWENLHFWGWRWFALHEWPLCAGHK